jgi:hypothetical protein
MRASGPISRLPMGHLEKPLWTRRIEIVKKRTVMQNRNLCPSLCVPGDLSVMQREVAVAFRLQVDNSERSPHPSQDPSQAVSNIPPFGIQRKREHQGIIQAPWPQQHSASTGAPSEHGDFPLLARIEIHITLRPTGLPQDDAFLHDLPKTQDAIACCEQFFVKTKIVSRIR